MRADDILATLYRQTMFAEFELKTHEFVENGTPLTAELLRKTYRELLELYFGPEMVFEQNSDMEGYPVLYYSLKCFQECSKVTRIILVTGQSEIEYCKNHQ